MIDRTSHNSPVLDAWQAELLDAIEPLTAGHTLVVTRGHSLPVDQLRTIENYGRLNGLLAACPEFVRDNLVDKVAFEQDLAVMVYRWQRLWSLLLNKFSTTGGKQGAKINPPYAAVCLYDYFRSPGENMKGKLIQPSPHIKDVPSADDIEKGAFKPCPIDFSQHVDGGVNIGLVEEIMKTAKAELERRAREEAFIGPRIRNITVEPANGCVHIDLTGRTA